MQEYQSHKKVHAAKITSIVNIDHKSSRFTFEDDSTQGVDRAFMQKHQPGVGGYYMRYADGYESFSPAKAFEEGYEPLENTAKIVKLREEARLAEAKKLAVALAKVAELEKAEKARATAQKPIDTK